MTSFSAAAQVRRALGEKKCGHGGTLDPEATGVLPVLVGRATRLSDYFLTFHKTYEAGLKFGYATDTGDVWGSETKRHCPGQDRLLAELTGEDIEKAAASFVGRISQTPPAYSALKVGGVNAYTLARKGIDPGLKPRPVNIYDIRLLSFDRDNALASIRVECGRGTYIRTLCEDIAGRLGLLGTMASLVRVSYGPLAIEDAVELDDVRLALAGADNDSVPDFLQPCDSVLMFLEKLELGGKQADDYVHGRPVYVTGIDAGTEQAGDGAEPEQAGGAEGSDSENREDRENHEDSESSETGESRDLRVYGPDGRFLGVGIIRDGSLRSRISFF